MTPEEKFRFDLQGFLVVKNVLIDFGAARQAVGANKFSSKIA